MSAHQAKRISMDATIANARRTEVGVALKSNAFHLIYLQHPQPLQNVRRVKPRSRFVANFFIQLSSHQQVVLLFKECNTCRYTTTGLWACTRRACIPDNHDRVPATTPSGLQSRFNEHEIHDSNDSDGNTQTTTDFGIRVPVKGSHNKNENGGSSTVAPSVQRTIRPYHPSGTANRIVTEAELQDPHFKCVPSLSFKVDCNTCWCAADGKGARSCTRVACKPKTYAPLNPQ